MKGSAAKLRLYRANPHCFWCGTRTRIVDTSPMPDDGATVDSVRSRFQPMTGEAPGDWPPDIKVLCCFGCNKQRDQNYIARLLQPKPAPTISSELVRAQGDLCAKVRKFVMDGGDFGEGGSDIRHHLAIVEALWARRHSEKQAANDPELEEIAF